MIALTNTLVSANVCTFATEINCFRNFQISGVDIENCMCFRPLCGIQIRKNVMMKLIDENIWFALDLRRGFRDAVFAIGVVAFTTGDLGSFSQPRSFLMKSVRQRSAKNRMFFLRQLRFDGVHGLE